MTENPCDLILMVVNLPGDSGFLRCQKLRNNRLKNRGTNTVVLRGLSGKMTMNSLLIGALATILVFAIAMSNVALGEKVYSDRSVQKDCPYDVMAMLDCSSEPGISMEEGETIIGKYSPIQSRMDYQLYSAGETTLCSSIVGYDLMGWTDKFMPLSQFNALLKELTYIRKTEDGTEEWCDLAIREEYRLWSYANAGTLIIGALYVSTVFVCMALAILSVKTLSTLDEERRGLRTVLHHHLSDRLRPCDLQGQ